MLSTELLPKLVGAYHHNKNCIPLLVSLFAKLRELASISRHFCRTSSFVVGTDFFFGFSCFIEFSVLFFVSPDFSFFSPLFAPCFEELSFSKMIKEMSKIACAGRSRVNQNTLQHLIAIISHEYFEAKVLPIKVL